MLRRLTRRQTPTAAAAAEAASPSLTRFSSAANQTDLSDGSPSAPSPFSSPSGGRPRNANEKSTATDTIYPVDYTIELFSKPHTISILVLMLLAFLYVALYVTDIADTERNAKIGLVAMCGVFLVLGILMFKDGPFMRPHVAMWRLVLALSALYLLALVFLLFQNVDDARQMMRFFDSSLGEPLPERSYATNCELTYRNITDQLDEFVWAHVIGWFCKAIMFRDYWIGWILSVMFEFLEYSLQHQLPNFAECWWDHWILDVLVCNWLGLWIGMRTCHYLELKTYSWRGFRQIPTYGGKVKRAVQQFTPYSWTKFEWAYTKNAKHFFVTLMLIIITLQAELNAFYLKYLLWLPPKFILNPARLVLMFLNSTAAIRELYQYLTDKTCKRLGAHAWVSIAIIMTETLICIKFGRNQFHEPTPLNVVVFWLALAALLAIYALWRFVLFRTTASSVNGIASDDSPQKVSAAAVIAEVIE